MQELYSALNASKEELLTILPTQEGETQYMLRYLATFFPDILYKTSFVQYMYADLSDENPPEYFQAYCELQNVFGRRRAAIPLLLGSYNEQISKEEYFAYLACFDLETVLQAMVKDDFYGGEISQSIVHDYFSLHQDKMESILERCQDREVGKVFSPYVIKQCRDHDNVFGNTLSCSKEHFSQVQCSLPYDQFESLLSKRRALLCLLPALQLSIERNDERYLQLTMTKWNERERGVITSRFARAIKVVERTQKELVLLLKTALQNKLFVLDKRTIIDLYNFNMPISVMFTAGVPKELLVTFPAGKKWFLSCDV